MKTLRFLRFLALSLCASFVFVTCNTIGPDEPTPQDPVEYTLSVSPGGPVEFPAEGGRVEFSAKTNADHTECDYSKKDWFTVAYDKSSKLYIVSVTANETGNEREFDLTFYATHDDKKVATEVVKAVQPAVQVTKMSVSVNPATLEFPAEGSQMNTVVTWSEGVNKLRYSLRSDVKSWITAKWTNSNGKKLLVVTAGSNNTGKGRSGIIDIYAGITTEDMDNAQNGNMDPTRVAMTELVVIQPAGGSGGGTTPKKPSTPTGVQAVLNGEQIIVSWNASSGAEFYRVYYDRPYPYNGATFENCYQTYMTFYPKTIYGVWTFWIVAVSSDYQTSDASSKVTLNYTSGGSGGGGGGGSQSQLNAPQNLEASSGYSFVQISFDPVPAAYDYYLYRSTSPNSGYSKITASGGSSGNRYVLTDQNPKNGTTYYKVKAIALPSTGIKDSEYSSYVKVTR